MFYTSLSYLELCELDLTSASEPKLEEGGVCDLPAAVFMWVDGVPPPTAATCPMALAKALDSASMFNVTDDDWGRSGKLFAILLLKQVRLLLCACVQEKIRSRL